MRARVGSSCCLLGVDRSTSRAGTGEAAWTVTAEFCRCHICAPESQERAYQSQEGKPLLPCLSTSFCWQRSLPAKQRKALKNPHPLLQSRQRWVIMDMGRGRQYIDNYHRYSILRLPVTYYFVANMHWSFAVYQALHWVLCNSLFNSNWYLSAMHSWILH